MLDFRIWLQLTEDRSQEIPQEILDGYETAFQASLKELLSHTDNPVHRQQIQAAMACPIRDSLGNCRAYSDYIIGAMRKKGLFHRYDAEAVLSYIVQQMLLTRSLTTGNVRPTVFGDFNPDQTPDVRGGLQARFMIFLNHAIRNVAKGKIPRLGKIERRPPGTVSFGLGRRKEADPGNEIHPDEIAARPSSDLELAEIVEDISILLRKKEPVYGLPLVGLFRAIMSGKNAEQQREMFGYQATKEGRPIVIQTIKDYAASSGNFRLLNLLSRYEGFQSNKPLPPGRKLEKTKKQVLPPGKERDYASLLSVVDRFNRPIGSAQFGSFRRQWLKYPPRDPNSGYRNRLEEVLARMVDDGVLKATRTGQGAFLYSPGPNANAYRQQA